MQQFLLKLFAALSFLFIVKNVNASCDSIQQCNNGCCCKQIMTPGNVMLNHIHRKGEGMLTASYMNSFSNGLKNGNQSNTKEEVFANYLMVSDKMKMDMYMLMMMYGISNRFTGMMMTSYSSMRMNMEMLPVTYSIHHHQGSMADQMTTSGWNDIQLFGLYLLKESEYSKWIITGGISIPVGKINRKGNEENMYDNLHLPYMMQSGSGTLDLLPGVNYTYQKNKMATGGLLNAKLRSYNNAFNYHYGNEWQATEWFSYGISEQVYVTSRMDEIFQSTIHGKDNFQYSKMEAAANPVNYGGFFINGFIGIGLQSKHHFFNRFKFSSEIGKPIYARYNGIQIPFVIGFQINLFYNF